MRNAWFFTLILAAASVHAQVDKWQLGGSGVAWDQQDSLEVLVDFVGAPGAIQPRYLQPDQNIIHLLENWEFWRTPSLYNLGYVDGQNALPQPANPIRPDQAIADAGHRLLKCALCVFY